MGRTDLLSDAPWPDFIEGKTIRKIIAIPGKFVKIIAN